MAVLDQIKTHRPAGIKAWFNDSCQSMGKCQVEQLMLQVLRESILEGYSQNKLPCEQEYFNTLKKMALVL